MQHQAVQYAPRRNVKPLFAEAEKTPPLKIPNLPILDAVCYAWCLTHMTCVCVVCVCVCVVDVDVVDVIIVVDVVTVVIVVVVVVGGGVGPLL